MALVTELCCVELSARLDGAVEPASQSPSQLAFPTCCTHSVHGILYYICRVIWASMQVLWTFRQASPFAYDHQRCAGQMLRNRMSRVVSLPILSIQSFARARVIAGNSSVLAI